MLIVSIYIWPHSPLPSYLPLSISLSLSVLCELLILPPVIILYFHLFHPSRIPLSFALSSFLYISLHYHLLSLSCSLYATLSLSVPAHSPELCFLVKVTVSLHLLWLSKSITRAASMYSSIQKQTQTSCSHQASCVTVCVLNASMFVCAHVFLKYPQPTI